MHVRLFVASFLLFGAGSVASAAIHTGGNALIQQSLSEQLGHFPVYGGSPKLDFSAGDGGTITGGSVELEKLVLHHCDSSQSEILINEHIDPTDGWDEDIDPGCYSGVSVVWGNAMSLTGSGFSLTYDPTSTYVALTGTTQSAPLDPYNLDTGTYSGTPLLTVTIE